MCPRLWRRMRPPWLLLLLWALPAVRPYGFRNCIQSPWDAGLFRCVQRFVDSVGAAVADLPPAATALNLSHNAVARVPPAAFAHLPRLRSLDVAYNHLDTVAPGAFAGLAALATLDLSHNRLAALSEGSFAGLEALVKLDLAHNRLAALATGALAGLGNLSALRLDRNPLAVVSPDALVPLANLSRLSLRRCRLPTLGPVVVAVRPLRRLQLLDLCGNRVSALGPTPALPPALRVLRLCNNSLGSLAGAERGLAATLRVLDLSYNNISAAEPFARLNLRNLSRLHVAGNPLNVSQLLRVSDVQPRSLDLSGLRLELVVLDELCRLLGRSALRQLQLHRNGLRTLPEGALAACPPARTLDLSRNRLQRLDCVGRLLRPEQQQALQEVVVEHNLLRSLPSCQEAPTLPQLHNVSLRFNRILVVGPHAFADAPRLRVLRLNINGLACLNRDALRGLTELRELRLDNNLLTDLYPGAFGDLGQLRSLNLRNNRVSVLFSGAFAGLAQLETLDLGGNNLRHLGAAALRGLGRLRRLYLDRNRLQEVSAEAFRPVQASLGVLDLSANNLRFITQRPRQRPPFRRLRHLYDLKLQAQQPYGLRIIPHGFFQGLNALRSLYLAQNWLLAVSADAFDDLAELRYLTLADCSGGMGDLPAGVFKNLSNLRILDLENAGLRSLGTEVFGNLSRLERLRLGKNELRTLDPQLDGRLPALRYLDLRKCPLSCACTNAWLPGWLGRGRVQVVYLYNYSCGGSGPPAYLHAFDTRVCFLDVGLYLFAGTAPAVVLLLALPLLYHRAYWRLRYHLYLLRAWVNGHWRREERRYAYDSFVSYNSADEGWVLGELVPELEGASLRLCLHHRDFSPGKAIVDNIVDAIYNSRKTVCVLSRSYLRSEWCSLEIQLASYRLFDELRDVLVLIFLEAIPDAELSAYHRMRRVLLKRTYLRWPPEPPAQRLFWAKLKRALRSGYADGEEEEEEKEGSREGSELP
ncbi:toll-like receptor 13 [Cuculus canorus]|uniref:toll-like receptor 13 n=1 Tax=Cuculus canorus TaxID=55661 RepID=UPI0023AA7BAB|nr:toll-like receptor 13 [Cuculus canorus]